jgi:hypothetical protein
MKPMRAKMRVESVTPIGNTEQVNFRCVAKSTAYPEDGSDEDNTFAKFSPSGSAGIQIANPALIGQYAVGDTYYVDFTPVAE